MSENKFEFHFHGNVGQNIANVEHMEVHMDKEGNIQVMNAEQVATWMLCRLPRRTVSSEPFPPTAKKCPIAINGTSGYFVFAKFTTRR